MENKTELTQERKQELLKVLRKRFENHRNRHVGIDWEMVASKLEATPSKLWSLNEMEKSGGEPDVVGVDQETVEYLFFDCSSETPAGRRSLCYDREALDSRKEFKPESSATEMAEAIGIELLSWEQYQELQKLGNFDSKTSSWLKTPIEIRILGGAIYGDFRYNTAFLYHNGASSYYAVRGFRGWLKV